MPPETRQRSPAGADGEVRQTLSAALFAPIAPPTAFEQTVERLGSAIRLGIVSPGSRLPPERELAEAFGISRGTLRQAIVALVHGGLLTTRRGRTGGTWVATEIPTIPPPEDLPRDVWDDVLDQRLAAEVASALLASRRADPGILSEMEAACAEMEAIVREEREYVQYRQFDARFHLLLAEASGSRRLVAQSAEAQDAISRLARVREWPTVVLRRSNRQHRQLLKSLRAHDGGAAAELVFAHVEGTRLIVRGMNV